ncbi:RdgB/HAM1 family non-canonical purine NTP pyrophosphatase [Caldisericum exile]|uniref:dITP/XTP pyrophosphatase n=1 Tax=Caldisericum exile (strain DSM 21853 / NBRC 104410 / AZM16c01) TaxID=511051 RepID=A0A7U6GFI0_CALEA|nr:RdgB/HAM1 family non-canonical purine NTP pyrophosphatase [Caldisericum exile]BAL81450.1 nucleoside-triphosphatase [Caldisericum exile AZM16c01]
MVKILVATKNKGKLKEIQEILGDLPIKLMPLPESASDVEENGSTYLENALIKAKTYGQKYKLITLADDSGLEIDALNGLPGIYSSRYLGKDTPFEEKMKNILELMKNKDNRKARFRCISVLYFPNEDKFVSFEGVVEGEILKEICYGNSGFGYDPIFKPDGFDKSFSELGTEIKNKISHRSKALAQVRDYIENNLLGGEMIEIKINGKRLPANKYVYSVFEKVIYAILSTLKDLPEIETVEIKIEKKEEK